MASGTLYRTIGRTDATAGHPPGERESSTDFFIMNNLLYSRMESGHPSNDAFYDEDVNVYLANMLEALMKPGYHEMLRSYIVPWDLSLFEAVNVHSDPRSKYMAYRINADYLMVNLGIFDNPRGRRPGSLPEFEPCREIYLGRAKAYYAMARSYCQQARMCQTAMSDIMGKLSDGLERYVEVLSTMKSQYFNIFDRISSGEMYHLECSVKKEVLKQSLSELHDEFLDAYSNFLKEKSEKSRQTLEEAVARIKEADPSFGFEIELA